MEYKIYNDSIKYVGFFFLGGGYIKNRRRIFKECLCRIKVKFMVLRLKD